MVKYLVTGTEWRVVDNYPDRPFPRQFDDNCKPVLERTPDFGPAGEIAKVDRLTSEAAIVDLPRSAVVQGWMRAFVARETLK